MTISTVIVSQQLAIKKQVTLLLSILFKENGERETPRVCDHLYCFRMSFEKTDAKFNINEKQDLNLLLIYLLSNSSSIFCLTNTVILSGKRWE